MMTIPGICCDASRIQMALFVVSVLLLQPSSLEDSCVNDADCVGDNQVCSSNDTNKVCVCAAGFVPDSQACRLPKYWENCETDCEDNLICQNIATATDTTTQSPDRRCSCPVGDYYNTHSHYCQNKKSHGEKCATREECAGEDGGLVACVSYYEDSQPTRCLCKDTQAYYSHQRGTCVSLNNLRVKSVRMTSRSHHSVTFSWTVVQESGVYYRIKREDDDDDDDLAVHAASDLGGTFYGLQSGTSFTFRIESYIRANSLYGETIASQISNSYRTLPAQPGYIDLSLSQLSTSPMTIAFTPAVGHVDFYHISIMALTVILDTNVNFSVVADVTLTPGVTYDYVIEASCNGEWGGRTTGTFTAGHSGKTFWGDCEASSECKNTLSCIDKMCSCRLATEYTDQNQCRTRKQIGDQCTLQSECVGESNLSCFEGVCTCSPDFYHLDNVCRPLKYRTETCSNKGNECGNPLVCSHDKMCECDYHYQYTNTAVCADRKGHLEACSASDECSTLFQCDSDRDVCDCGSHEYWDGGVCAGKKPFGYLCSEAMECQGSLVCEENQCGCDWRTQYGIETMCLSRKPFEASCTLDSEGNECTGNMACIEGTCGCRQDSHFYDSQSTLECQLRKDEYENCFNIVNECKSPLSCLGGECGCPDEHYFDGSQCLNQKPHADVCSETKECLDEKIQCGYSGQNSDDVMKCLCRAGYYWNNAYKTCRLLNELKVLTPRVDSRLTDSVYLSWTVSIQDPTVSYRIKVSPPEGNQTATHNGGHVTALTPGTEYAVVIESYVSSGLYGSGTSTRVPVASPVWTFPSRPGYFDASRSQLTANPMTFSFEPASGNLITYKLWISLGQTTVTDTDVSSGTTASGLTLLPGTTYDYRIVAYNGNGDSSPDTVGTFTTTDAVPGRVMALAVIEKATDSVQLQWRPPSSPNGQVRYFVVQIFQDGVCEGIWDLSCSNCGNSQTVPDLACGPPHNKGSFVTQQVNDVNKEFELTVTSLTTYTQYSVRVMAVNDAGLGEYDDVIVRTEESVAADLLDLNLTSFRESSNEKVGVSVEWRPGVQTGRTNYTVTLRNQEDFQLVSEVLLEGYEKTSTSFPGLSAHHMYHVTVIARTAVGSSAPIQDNVRTNTAIPGVIRDFKVIPDPVYARRVRLEFKCPLETERNGDIRGFSVVKENTAGTRTEYDIAVADCSDVISVTHQQLGTFEIKENYTFQVTAKNQDFESPLSNPLSFYPAPKKPVFTNPVMPDNARVVATPTTIQVALCTSCLTDPEQGEIIYAALVVCVKSETNNCTTNRKKRTALSGTEFKSNATWAEAKSNDFNVPYRPTSDTWLDTLTNNGPPSTSYVIGQDSQCQDDPAQKTYCNGPLPSGREIIVTAVACTDAGCQAQSSTGALKTQEPADIGSVSSSFFDDTNNMIYVIVPCAIVIVIIVIIVGVAIKRRRPPKPEDQERQQEQTEAPHADPDAFFRVPSVTIDRGCEIRNFISKVSAMHRNENAGFVEEFEELHKLSHFLYPTGRFEPEGRESDNGTHSMSEVRNSRASDLLDANFIPGLESRRDYIATSGPPTQTTVPAFWRMVWDQKSKVIISLAKRMENNKLAPDPFVPQTMDPVTYGVYTVQVMKVSRINKSIVTELCISVTFREHSTTHRRVTLFSMPVWWGEGQGQTAGGDDVTSSDVLDFVVAARERVLLSTPGPIVVKCSAGAGSPGIFIALDYAMQFIQTHSLADRLDIFKYVITMRKNRPEMVHDLTQYMFLHDLLVQMIERKIEKDHIYEHIYESADSQFLPDQGDGFMESGRGAAGGGGGGGAGGGRGGAGAGAFERREDTGFHHRDGRDNVGFDNID